MPDRRHNRRLPVDLLVNRFLDGYPYLCRVTDISRSGMRVVPLIEPSATGTPRFTPRFMGLQFQLPGTDEVLTGSGEEVFAEGERGSFGIRFTRLPSTTAAVLDRFMMRNEIENPDPQR
jgi:hypothetical protein